MSLSRFVYYSAVIGGWAALLAWLVAEVLFLHRGRLGGTVETVLTGALVGAALGAGLSLVSGMSNPSWRRQLHRIMPGLIGGGIGGAVGGLLGAFVYAILAVPAAFEWLPRALGWIVMGLGIGSAEGLYEASRTKIRNGLIGGCLGGLVGGLLFDPIAGAGSGMFSRAAAFVILGLSIGALIGLTHVVLKEAWLTVLDGFSPGRQLILAAPVTTLGRGDHLPLPFLGYAGRDLESEHLGIVRHPEGSYFVEDKGSRIGTRLNGELIAGPSALSDGDLIKLGTNLVRFNHRRRGLDRGVVTSVGSSPGAVAAAPPPPPPVPREQAARFGSAGPPPLPSAQAPDDSAVRESRGSCPRIPPPPPPPS